MTDRPIMRFLASRRVVTLLAALALVAVGVGLYAAVIRSSPTHDQIIPSSGEGGFEFGAYTNVPDNSVASFKSLQAVVPGIRVRRSFSPRMPASIRQTPAAGDAAAGIVTFLSVKPSYTNVGSDNAKITSLAKSLPAGSYLTAWHEPENDMTGAQYVAMFRNFYKVAKAANPNIYVGNVYMTYQWGVGRKVSNPDAWWVGSDSTDFLGTDTYSAPGRDQVGDEPVPLDRDQGQLRWHAWASAKQKPLLVAELGVSQRYSDGARAACYRADADWLRSHGYRMLLIWNGAGTPPDGQSWDFWAGERGWPQTLRAIQRIGRGADAAPRGH